MRIKVQPASDGHDMQSNWEVVGRGKTTSHTNKQAAKNEADRRAHEGDTKVYKGTNGQILKTVTHRGGNSESEKATMFGPGVRAFKTGISDAFK